MFKISEKTGQKGYIGIDEEKQQGTVYIDEDAFTDDTPFHEFLHPFVKAIKNSITVNAKQLYRSLEKEVQEQQYAQILERLRTDYPDKSDEEIFEEAIVEIAGRYASGSLKVEKRVCQTSQQVLSSYQFLCKRFNVKVFKRRKKNIMNPDKLKKLKLHELGALFGIGESGLDLSTITKKSMNNVVHPQTARRSFCSNAFLSGVPIMANLKITEHKTERAFMQYIKATQLENAIVLSRHPFFK